MNSCKVDLVFFPKTLKKRSGAAFVQSFFHFLNGSAYAAVFRRVLPLVTTVPVANVGSHDTKTLNRL